MGVMIALLVSCYVALPVEGYEHVHQFKLRSRAEATAFLDNIDKHSIVFAYLSDDERHLRRWIKDRAEVIAGKEFTQLPLRGP